MNISGRYTPALWAAIWLVATHFVVVLLHGTAHIVLGIVPSVVENAFIVIVIGLAPVVALPFVLRGSRAGAGILTLALAASWLYGMVNHFIIEGADHVTGLDHGAWQTTFTITGILLLVLEAVGTLLAAWLFWRAGKSQPRIQPRNTSTSEAPLATPR